MKHCSFRVRMLVLIVILFLSISSVYAETIVLKSGYTVEGKLLEKTDKYIKIDFQGVPITYFLDEVESIDGVKQASSQAEVKKLSQENNLPTVHAETVEEYVSRGAAYFKQGNFTQAISDFTRAIEINPNYAEAYAGRAITYLYEKEYDKTWADVHKAEGLGYVIEPDFINDLKKASGRDK